MNYLPSSNNIFLRITLNVRILSWRIAQYAGEIWHLYTTRKNNNKQNTVWKFRRDLLCKERPKGCSIQIKHFMTLWCESWKRKYVFLYKRNSMSKGIRTRKYGKMWEPFDQDTRYMNGNLLEIAENCIWSKINSKS